MIGWQPKHDFLQNIFLQSIPEYLPICYQNKASSHAKSENFDILVKFYFLAFRHMFEGLNDDLIGQCRLKLMSKCIFSKTFVASWRSRAVLAHHTARLTGFEKTFIVVFKFVIFLAFRCWCFIFPVKFTRIKII